MGSFLFMCFMKIKSLLCVGVISLLNIGYSYDPIMIFPVVRGRYVDMFALDRDGEIVAMAPCGIDWVPDYGVPTVNVEYSEKFSRLIKRVNIVNRIVKNGYDGNLPVVVFNDVDNNKYHILFWNYQTRSYSVSPCKIDDAPGCERFDIWDMDFIVQFLKSTYHGLFDQL